MSGAVAKEGPAWGWPPSTSAIAERLSFLPLPLSHQARVATPPRPVMSFISCQARGRRTWQSCVPIPATNRGCLSLSANEALPGVWEPIKPPRILFKNRSSKLSTSRPTPESARRGEVSGPGICPISLSSWERLRPHCIPDTTINPPCLGSRLWGLA